jgi:LPXTG-site transpeptidase (sortase) family protein
VTAVVDSDPDRTIPVAVAGPDGAEPAPFVAPGPGLRRTLTLVGAGVALFVVLLIAFEGPIAHVWYQTRQQSLAANLTGKRKADSKGQATAVLQIPRINLNLVVVQGDGPAQLRGGPGHRIGTPAPGALGNSLVFGHRNGWGGSLANLSKLQLNDSIVVKNRTGEFPFVFQVVSIQRVSAGDTRLLSPSTDHRLTLVTSAGGRFATKRLVVVAVSGSPGRLLAPGRSTPAQSPHESDLFNATTALLLVMVGGAVLVMRQLRGIHRGAMAVVMASPLALAALLALLLEVDLLVFPPFR